MNTLITSISRRVPLAILIAIVLASWTTSAASASTVSSPTKIFDGRYREISMAIDGGGYVHAAARGKDGLWYLTNRSGAWTQTPLTTKPRNGFDTLPSIAVDSSGNVHVAFERDTCLNCVPWINTQVLYLTNKGIGDGSFPSVPTEIAGQANSPSLRLHNDIPFVAYATCACDYFSTKHPVYLTWVVEGEWHDPLGLADRGDAPSLQISPSGTTNTAYSHNGKVSVARWRYPGSVEEILTLPYTRTGAERPSLALSRSGGVHVAWTVKARSSNGGGTYYARQVSPWVGGRFTKDRWAVDLVLDSDDQPHMLVIPKGIGIDYYRAAGDQLQPIGLAETALVDSAAVAIAPTGKAVILYTAFKYVPTGVYYVEATAP